MKFCMKVQACLYLTSHMALLKNKPICSRWASTGKKGGANPGTGALLLVWAGANAH